MTGPPAPRRAEVPLFETDPSFTPVVLFGTVKSTKDPLSLGRVQVEIQGFPKPLVLPWLRIVQPIASNKTGFFFLPETGDEVVLIRGDQTNADAMVIIGAFYSGNNKPKTADADGKNAIKQILTKAGNALTFRDKSGGEGIDLFVAGQKVKMTMDKKSGSITLETDKTITVKATNTVTVQAKDIEVKGDAKILVKGGTKVQVESGANVEIKGGAAVKISGGAKVEIAGPMINIG
jgi:phage baseplate assembly protein gpV